MSKHFRIAGRLPAKLRELGIGLPALLHNAGLPPDLFDQPRILVTTEALFALWRTIGRVSDDPAIGLELGTETKAEQFDPIAMAALCNATFGDAMRQVSRHKQLSCPEEIIHELAGDEWAIQFRWLLGSGVEPDALTDLCFAWVLSIARHGTGTRLCPLRVEFVHTRPYARKLARHFGCPIQFGAVRNAIIFRATDASQPFITRNADLLSMLAPQLDEELQQHHGQESFPDRVRASIQRKLTGARPKMHDIARELHISSRTLQRRLQDAGLSYQEVLEDARHLLARHYLNHSMLELNETAYLLGYEDANSFVRAFRTWEGIPPAQWRGAQRTQAAPQLNCASPPASAESTPAQSLAGPGPTLP